MNIRQKKALQTKNKILTAALSLFNEKGFSNVTVDEIIEKTNSSKGAFYNHFKSKHDIFFEKFKEIDHFYLDELLPQLEKDAPANVKLKTFFKIEMEFIESEFGWDVTRSIYEAELNVERESFFLIPDRPLYQILKNLCEEGQEAGLFRTDITSEQMVTILARMIRGILYDWSISKGQYSLSSEQDLLFDVAIRGLTK
ncbi:TetR/AcrR family transcriptional regulator [Cytobacillus purgationiresistens]|uniref:AcrR family transcriptional regulator n=1 Tax=Cytobacillus purgationiresistens TaxID=863449 RepID=A0ABU0AGL6_9BACI|nr:TetR/AcrR family transcriptional regulator [Cytobacillus purgationiresistens]MDQ0270400.1 AcrR family transcriptional regulator [Cytobacillus purgationiresistens]